MKKVLVSLVTHSAYKDICDNFLEMFDKNWNDCNYDFCISIIGDKIIFPGRKIVYHGNKCTLPQALYNVVNDFEYDYCISFLGDAFINKKIDNKMVNHLIKDMESNNIDYCNLVPRIAYRLHKKKVNKNKRYISTNDSYNMSFTDLDFEEKYLNRGDSKGYWYKNRVILTKNLFGLCPGITAGKWDRHVLKKLKNENPEIQFSKREMLSYSEMLKNDMIVVFQIFASQRQRIIMKKVISKITGIKFVTEY